jgi:hypothetical protein
MAKSLEQMSTGVISDQTIHNLHFDDFIPSFASCQS